MVAWPAFANAHRLVAHALRPEPTLMRADHLAADDAPGEIIRRRWLRHGRPV